MQNDLAQIDRIYTRAILTEVGERLRLILGDCPTVASAKSHRPIARTGSGFAADCA